MGVALVAVSDKGYFRSTKTCRYRQHKRFEELQRHDTQRGLKLKRSHLTREIVEVVVFVGLAGLIILFTIQSYNVTSTTGMEPGLVANQHIMVNKIGYLFHSPARGDVIVFNNPQPPYEDLMKRVIGLPGDTITTDNTHVWVNNVLLNEPYITQPINTVANTWHIPANAYFVLSDNRANGEDSRAIGPIPKDNIVGQAVLVYWPITNVHFIDTHSDVFSHIKNP